MKEPSHLIYIHKRWVHSGNKLYCNDDFKQSLFNTTMLHPAFSFTHIMSFCRLDMMHIRVGQLLVRCARRVARAVALALGWLGRPLCPGSRRPSTVGTHTVRMVAVGCAGTWLGLSHVLHCNRHVLLLLRTANLDEQCLLTKNILLFVKGFTN